MNHAKKGIRANVVCQGYVDTQLARAIKEHGKYDNWIRNIPLQRSAVPEELAVVIAFAASNESSFMTGSVLVADGGLHARTGQPDLLSTSA